VEPAAQGASLPIPEDRSAATARPAYAGESPYAASCPTETVLSSMFADARIGGRQSAKRQRDGRRRCSRCSVGSRHGTLPHSRRPSSCEIPWLCWPAFPLRARHWHPARWLFLAHLSSARASAPPSVCNGCREHTMRYDIITTLLFGGLHLLLRQAAARLAGSTNKRCWQSSAQHPG
jgi:hypothetical protein